MAGDHALTPTRECAMRAALAVAEALGLRVGAPAVLHDGSNLLVHLRPAPVVARVPTVTGMVRPGAGWLQREVAVAGHPPRCGGAGGAPGRAGRRASRGRARSTRDRTSTTGCR